ncbi:uncharacterized protein LOC116203178 [Punica granatum]|uniref:Uncharacterized protein LOC116203178 n=2 Tax=Punica granatum TaxID=22663 RepID=A0A6P8D0T5_PUNGR|nr:uncharacterized protein LOC116203178 [Punica granatum]
MIPPAKHALPTASVLPPIEEDLSQALPTRNLTSEKVIPQSADSTSPANEELPLTSISPRIEKLLSLPSRRSERIRNPPDYLKDFVCNIATIRPPRSISPAHSSSPNSDVEPRSYKEAFQDSRWRIAMNEEICALELNKMWTIEPIPSDKKPIGCKWVFKIKRNADGSVERFKARLVAKGFTQVEEIDFTETFVPVVKLVTDEYFYL